MKKILTVVLLLFCSVWMHAQYATRTDISYVPASEQDAYRKERCKLDIYYPEKIKDFPTIVWFHGGGMEGGQKHLQKELMDKGCAVVSVNYRLSPRAKNPTYIEDAAEAVAWTMKHIKEYGGDPSKIYISGHSAGGYLTLIVGIDKHYLEKYGVDADELAGLLPISGQTNTHFTIRKERNLPDGIPVIDEYAPINRVHKGLPPICLITGDRDLEMTARYEENAHLAAILKAQGNKSVWLYELQGFDHGGVAAPGCYLVVNMIKKWEKDKTIR